MKRVVAVAAAILGALPAAHAEDVWVQVRESVLRSEPEFYAAPVVTVRYGDRLERVSEQNGWVRVRSGRREGFVPLSALTAQRVVLTSDPSSKVKADSSDVVLAGKGFSKEVEEQYKMADSSARFDLVDQVERQSTVGAREVQQFMKSGGLKG